MYLQIKYCFEHEYNMDKDKLGALYLFPCLPQPTPSPVVGGARRHSLYVTSGAPYRDETWLIPTPSFRSAVWSLLHTKKTPARG